MELLSYSVAIIAHSVNVAMTKSLAWWKEDWYNSSMSSVFTYSDYYYAVHDCMVESLPYTFSLIINVWAGLAGRSILRKYTTSTRKQLMLVYLCSFSAPSVCRG